jgi:hypothetical protein
MPFQKNAPQVVQFVCYDGMTPTDPTNPVTTISKNSGDFVPTTNSPVVVDDGYVTVELTATEMAAKRIEKELAQGRLFCPDEKKPKTGSLFIDENRKGKAQ